jgi:predicted solute-binding protein
VPFSYYNPQTGTYTTLHTDPVKVHVSKGKNYNPAVVQKNNLTDIHPIVSTPLSKLVFHGNPLFFTAGYWSIYALLLLAFAGLLLWRKRKDTLSKDTVRLRNRRASKVALRRLSTAKKFLQQNAQSSFYEEISKAVWLYLSDKLNISLSELSREKAQEVLQTKQADTMLLERIDTVMNDCETALYAPNSGVQHMQRTYDAAVDILSKLESVL